MNEDRSMKTAASDIETHPEPQGAGEVVLVVEDDPRLRQITSDRIAGLGYRVLMASDGATAFQVLDQQPGIRLLFSDIVMPGGISGLDLAKRARERNPALCIVLTTGYAAELLNETGDSLGMRILRKPYRKAELAHVLREALHAR
jgi:CheY-like chemotaxis protein